MTVPIPEEAKEPVILILPVLISPTVDTQITTKDEVLTLDVSPVPVSADPSP